MKSINIKAPVKCNKSITIMASSKKVWEILTNINNWNSWQTDISKSKLNGELKPNSTFDWKSGGAKIHSTLHTVEFGFKRLCWTEKTFGMFAIHNWTITEKDGKTEVSVEESLEGLFAKLLKNTLNKDLEKGCKTGLAY